MERKIIKLNKEAKRSADKSLAKFKGTNFKRTVIGYVEGRISKKQYVLITQEPKNRYYIKNGNFGIIKIFKVLDRLRKRVLNEIRKTRKKNDISR